MSKKRRILQDDQTKDRKREHALENRITSTTEIETLQTETTLTLDELVQQGAKRMLEAALTAEVESYIQRHQSERDVDRRSLVVRNGKSCERTIHTGTGTLKITAPRVSNSSQNKFQIQFFYS